MSDRPLTKAERETLDRIAFLRRLGIYDGQPPTPRDDAEEVQE